MSVLFQYPATATRPNPASTFATPGESQISRSFGLWPTARRPRSGPGPSISVSDLYQHHGPVPNPESHTQRK